MLELCELIKINVNELLTGERIIMDNYKDVAENILLLVSWLAGRTIGKDLGEFIYNVTH